MSMQQKCNKFSQFIVNWFDNIIDDIVAEGWERVELRDALDLSEIVAQVNLKREAEGREQVVVPPSVTLRVLEYAKQRPSHRLRNSYLTTLQQQATVLWAQERMDYLHQIEGLPIQGDNGAKAQAAKEAAELAHEEFGASSIAASTIEHRIGYRSLDDTLLV
jgi:hypothetical protein